jgi:hypothetical protein
MAQSNHIEVTAQTRLAARLRHIVDGLIEARAGVRDLYACISEYASDYNSLGPALGVSPEDAQLI